MLVSMQAFKSRLKEVMRPMLATKMRVLLSGVGIVLTAAGIAFITKIGAPVFPLSALDAAPYVFAYGLTLGIALEGGMQLHKRYYASETKATVAGVLVNEDGTVGRKPDDSTYKYVR